MEIPLCQKCGIRKVRWRPEGNKFRKICYVCQYPYRKVCRGLQVRLKNKYTIKQIRQLFPNYIELSNNKRICAICKFEPKHSCQMDIDHIDGNVMNDSKENLQVLCANCHRLKTVLSNDFLKV